ncbi:MAG: DUF4130 domain-containing protein [Planctomycetota bacterium]|nr:MAG: DUF4130 domain-containing protein [Planctomycetota bacterium]
MQVVVADTFEEWRRAARQLLRSDTEPAEVLFRDSAGQRGLFDDGAQLEKTAQRSRRQEPRPAYRVPKEFLDLARKVSCHRDSDRWERLYRTLWRLTHGERRLLEVTTDDDVHRLLTMEKSVRRDAHKMKAFVRFRRVLAEGEEHFIAWHRPDHRIVRLTAPFFSRRFPDMFWSILTPGESVSWDKKALCYGPGVPASASPETDELEDLWRTYYGNIFNPARVNLATMTREMPVRHWATLPETDIIDDLLADAPRRVDEMVARQEGFATSAADFLPMELELRVLRAAARTCEGCHLHRAATQTVFGEGPPDAKIVLVGEQPGDQEDLAGRPFVGPAGDVLNDALSAVGIDREQVYLTNAVKHFKYEPRGKRRLHKRPDAREMSACKPWVEAELTLLQPNVLVCLGATAAQQLIGRDFRLTQQRGRAIVTQWCDNTIPTYHPSAVLRNPDPIRRERLMATLVADLRAAKTHLC